MHPEKKSALFDNRLLASLPDEDHRQVLTRCELVELALDEVINEPGEQIRHVYFPTDCFVSLVLRCRNPETVGMAYAASGFPS